ncbi:MAG: hypothetical protein B6I31_01505 [Desulfobacteraceae bacterium 4572_19]|nr:MAG: hypothetical protein B6I31_01505 [Desulfobacteraceae bacterium 4572_19]
MIKIEPIGKEKNKFKDDDLVCYCFKYTKKDIESDFLDNGKSMILKQIALEKKNGRCDCVTKNPKRC